MSAAILWAVKESLLQYIAGAHGGRLELEGVENEAGCFSFPLESAEGVGEGLGVVRAKGTVRFFGHFGMPVQEIIDPWVSWGDGMAVLSIVRWPGRSQRIEGWDLRPLVFRDGELRAGLVRLSDAGGELFGQQYLSGTEFDPLLVRF